MRNRRKKIERMKEWHGNLTMKFYCKQQPLRISVNQINKTYGPNSTCSELRANIGISLVSTKPGLPFAQYLLCPTIT